MFVFLKRERSLNFNLEINWKDSLQIRRQGRFLSRYILSAVDMNLESIGYRGVAEPGHTWQPAGKHLAL